MQYAEFGTIEEAEKAAESIGTTWRGVYQMPSGKFTCVALPAIPHAIKQEYTHGWRLVSHQASNIGWTRM